MNPKNSDLDLILCIHSFSDFNQETRNLLFGFNNPDKETHPKYGIINVQLDTNYCVISQFHSYWLICILNCPKGWQNTTTSRGGSRTF